MFAQELHNSHSTALWFLATFLIQIRHWEHILQVSRLFEKDCELFLPLMCCIVNKVDFQIDYEHFKHWTMHVAMRIGLLEGIWLKESNQNQLRAKWNQNKINRKSEERIFTSLSQFFCISLAFLSKYDQTHPPKVVVIHLHC